MTEVVIAFRRPPSMSTSELREWVSALRLACARSVALSEPDGSSTEELRLRVQLDDGAGAAEEEITDLVRDMRLLGLRPAVASSVG